ncbi:hypothetical protein N7454_001317 [Penicillium verhagenii]|nr:hypothetical protein N7454_001317 [Penicillium verhagenii]
MTPPSRAIFEPFPTHLNLAELVETTHNFEFAKRITCQSIDGQPREDFDKLVLFHVIMLGEPLVIEGFHEYLDKPLFSSKWLQQNCQNRASNSVPGEQVRDLKRGINIPMSTAHYLKSLPTLSAPVFSSVPRTDQRLYLKDMDCPPEWQRSLEKIIPPSLFYFNNGPKPYKGPGSEFTCQTEYARTPEGETIAKSGDLMSCLPEEMRAQNLMCYIGPEGTYTPAHQEMCASLGHNIMVEASDGSMESGQATRPGSSVWFMTETKERDIVSDYWASVLGHDIDLEDHFAQLNAWIGAPFKTYVVEQRPGDLILIPPLAAHQVWNRGTRTMKVAWNRTTVETLRMAMNEALPHARMVCRDEQYKNKAIVFYALEHYSRLLRGEGSTADHPAVQQLREDFEKLFLIFTDVLLSENLPPNFPGEKGIEYVKFDSNITCSYCRCNIFNRFLTCSSCAMDGNDAYDVCLDCYVLGRSCHCISKLRWAEQFPWKLLRDRHATFRRQIIGLKNDKDRKVEFPLLAVALAQSGRKSTAQICLEQLAARPWVDPQNPNLKQLTSPTPSGTDGDDDQPRKKRRTQKKGEKTGSCHMCKNVEPLWKLATCSDCQLKYCYAILYRAFDIPPQEAMECSHWLCPRCNKKCNCTPCQKDPTMNPHEPYHVLLGHDTKKIADPRSVESLVTLRLPNLKWLPSLEENSQRRLKQRMEEAEQKRQKMWKDNAILMDPMQQVTLNGDSEGSNTPSYIPVDPALELGNGSFANSGQNAP